MEEIKEMLRETLLYRFGIDNLSETKYGFKFVNIANEVLYILHDPEYWQEWSPYQYMIEQFYEKYKKKKFNKNFMILSFGNSREDLQMYYYEFKYDKPFEGGRENFNKVYKRKTTKKEIIERFNLITNLKNSINFYDDNVCMYIKYLRLSYYELCNILKEKYGKVPGNYFKYHGPSGRYVYNKKIRRWYDGLFIHHIDEDKIPGLSEQKNANKYSEYQKADRLVYCNYLEHLLLHIKITQDYWKYYNNFPQRIGYPGAFLIAGEICDFFAHPYLYLSVNPCLEEIKDYFSIYAIYLRYFIRYLPKWVDSSKLFNCSDEKYEILEYLTIKAPRTLT